MNILSCNIHTFGAIFGLGVIGLCWALIITNKSPFPKEVVIAMTVTFALLVIHNFEFLRDNLVDAIPVENFCFHTLFL